MLNFFLTFLFFTNCYLQALTLDSLLKANDAASLKSYIKGQNRITFLKILCKKQKEFRKPPIACYELSLSADFWCLSLKIEDLNLKVLEEALQSSFLPSICHKYLKEKQKILFYRKKDVLLPKLKNYWTDQRPFF